MNHGTRIKTNLFPQIILQALIQALRRGCRKEAITDSFPYCSFGALLGKVTPTQILWILVLETPIYAINAKLADRLGALDIGGSITIHAFGAFYGLAASKV